jgi:hypothetical protein
LQSTASKLDGPSPEAAVADLSLPEAPEPQTPASSLPAKPNPCPPAPKAAPADRSTAVPGNNFTGGVARGLSSANPCTTHAEDWYQHFVAGPRDKPLTPRDKAWLAARNLADPFNNITILGEAAISVAADSHSPYGPGMAGYGRYVGVSYTQDLTGEFFGTFLIPAIAHQDPHYHRIPNAKIPRRIGHAIFQVVWTRSDNDKGMLNYANIVGFAADDEIANLYVPGRETNLGASATRYATGLATAPIGNFINEFLPDVANHIHVQIVVIQRIINQVARTETQNSAQ